MPMQTLERVTGNPNCHASDAVDRELTQARAALQQSSIYVLRKLQIDRDGETLIMRGRVDSYYHKQLAQELVKVAIDGAKVLNALQVVYTPKNDFYEAH